MSRISDAYRALWASPQIQQRIDADIERVRKSPARVRVVTPDGRPVSGAQVRCEQTSSSFHFGANIFMLGGYPSDELNARYEQAYTKLFNAATVPFYWKGLEPVRGERRYGADSAFVTRRPPPDVVVDFCERNGLRMHGHPFLWDFSVWSVPEWVEQLPMDEQARLWEAHVRGIAERYGHRLHRWDAVNEVLETSRRYEGHNGSSPMPGDYPGRAFTWANRYLPPGARLYINEATALWNPTNLELWIECIRGLLTRGLRVDGAGLQFHMFSDEKMAYLAQGEHHTPDDMFRTLDRLAPLGLGLHISEITLTSFRDDAGGREAQAEIARNFYRLWFSHPSVDSITWWNLPDGGACAGEDRVTSGLLDAGLAPKPAYTALHELIQNDWRTCAEGVTDDEGEFLFRGFHGDYKITINGRVMEVSDNHQGDAWTLEKTLVNDFLIGVE